MEVLALLLATVDPSEVWMIVCYLIGLGQGLAYAWLVWRMPATLKRKEGAPNA